MNFWSLDYTVPVVSVHKGQLEKFSSQTHAYLIIPTILLMGTAPLLSTNWLQYPPNIWVYYQLHSDYVIFLFQFLPSLFLKRYSVSLSQFTGSNLKHSTALTFPGRLYFQRVKATWIRVITTVVSLIQSYRFYTDLRLKKKFQFPALLTYSNHKQTTTKPTLPHIFIHLAVKKGIWKY